MFCPHLESSYQFHESILNNYFASDFFKQESPKKFSKYRSLIGDKDLNHICQLISFYLIDNYWQQYLAEIAEIRESIHLKRVGGQDPYVEFQKLVIKIFDQLMQKLDSQLVQLFNTIQIDKNGINLEKSGLKEPSATWTYQINDNPFEYALGMQLQGDVGKQIGAAMMTPFLALYLFYKSKRKL